VCCISSVAGLNGYFAAALYCASKHAIVGFVKSLGMVEEQEGVKVVGICPG
jgi:NAD(P)-dependent dehydrogenase (short-subunit alcohol dehydrogenase family)